MALRQKPLVTTASPGAAALVVEGYRAEGGSPTFLPPNSPTPNHSRVVVFTDTKLQAALDERVPDWRERGWLIIHNPKETQEAGEAAVLILAEHGQNLSDGG